MQALDKLMAKDVLDMEKEKAKEERSMATLELEKKRVANEEKKSRSKATKRGKRNYVSRHVLPQPDPA